MGIMAEIEKLAMGVLSTVNCRRCLGLGKIQTAHGTWLTCNWCGGNREFIAHPHLVDVWLRSSRWRDRISDFHCYNGWRKMEALRSHQANCRLRPTFAEWVWWTAPEYEEERQVYRVEQLKKLQDLGLLDPERPRYFEISPTPQIPADDVVFTEAAFVDSPTDPHAHILGFATQYQGVFPVAIDPTHPVGQISVFTSDPNKPVARIYNIREAARQEIERRLPKLPKPPWEEKEESDDPRED